MPQTYVDIFNTHPGVKSLIVLDYYPGEPPGLSADGTTLTLCQDESFAKRLALLEGADSDAGRISDDGAFRVRGIYVVGRDAYRAVVERLY